MSVLKVISPLEGHSTVEIWAGEQYLRICPATMPVSVFRGLIGGSFGAGGNFNPGTRKNRQSNSTNVKPIAACLAKQSSPGTGSGGGHLNYFAALQVPVYGSFIK